MVQYPKSKYMVRFSISYELQEFNFDEINKCSILDPLDLNVNQFDNQALIS